MSFQHSAEQQTAGVLFSASVVSLSPWSVFISWEKPQNNRQIKDIVIIGNVDQTVTTHLEEKYQFLFVDTGITPGRDCGVVINVYYVGGQGSYAGSGTFVDKPGTFCGGIIIKNMTEKYLQNVSTVRYPFHAK